MGQSWSEEAWRFALVVLAGTVVGLLVGHVAVVVLLAVIGYVFRHLYHIHRLQRWLDDPYRREMPAHFGLWGSVYAQIHRLLEAHRRREALLQQQLEQFRRTAAALPDAVVSLGPAHEILWVNEKARSMLGLRIPGDYGRPLANLFRAPALRHYLERGDYKKVLEIAAPGREQRQLSVRAVPYGDDQLLVIFQDVTERYRLERIRRDFVANVSHELRTPLTVISGFVENLRANPDICPEAWRRPLKLIDEQSGRMRQIVEDLLLLARLEGGEAQLREAPVDVAQLLASAAEEGRVLAEGKIEFLLNIESAHEIRGDAGLLRSAVANLISNAVHHTPAGGQIALHWVDEPGAACLIVEDNGEGISHQHIPRLTERFYRVDAGRSRERGGTGLGLAIVKHVLQVHDARLEILSEPGEGSQFICRFPKDRLVDPGQNQVTAQSRIVDHSP